jgi:selenocysteine-specific elongation factor
VLAALERFHAQFADEPGIDGARLRRQVAPALADATWRGVVRELLREAAIARSGNWLHLPAHRAMLSERELATARQLEDDVVAGGIDPPWTRDLAAHRHIDDHEARRLLRKCVAQGRLHQVVPDLFYSGAAMQELTAKLGQLAGDGRAVTAAEFRDAIGIGRKRTIQILEFFDRVGYTRRVRDAHVLRKDSDWGGALGDSLAH